jgi:outer membrane receptor protein involved in Fe transport
MSRNYIFSILFILMAFPAFAQKNQTRIYGKVSTAEKALSGIIISLENTSFSTETGSEGTFSINAPAGTYKLICSGIGYQTQTLKITLKENTSKKINITLTPDTVTNSNVETLDNVEIRGKSKKQKLETKGFAVNVIETQEASLRNIQTNELLNQTAGVRVRQNGGLGSFVEYNLNGMAGSSIGIFIDGIDISTYGSSFNLNTIPPAMIERIEIYKGVLPAYLSGDLLGGAINVILKKGGMHNNLGASVSYGSFNTTQADINGMYRDAKTGFTVRASGFYSYSDNNYEVWGKFVTNTLPNGRVEKVRAKRFNDAFRSFGSRTELGYTNVKWADNFMIGYTGSDTYKEVQHGQYMATPYKGRFTESQAHILSVNYSKKNVFTKDLEFNLNGVYSHRNQYIQDTVKWAYNWFDEKVIGLHGKPLPTLNGAQQGRPTMSTINRKVLNVRSDLQYRISKNHKLELNHLFYTTKREDYDELRTVLENNYLATSDITKNVTSLAYELNAFNSRLKANLFGKYYQQKVNRVDPKAVMINGENVRIEEITSDFRTTKGYGFATSYSITPNLVLLSSGEKAVKMPSESEVFGNQAENLIGNSKLRPEVSTNFNLGFRLDSYAINKHRFSFSSSGFVRNTKDKIVILTNDRPVSNVETFPYENLDATQAIGFEAELNYVFNNKLNVMLNMSKFSSLYKNKYSTNGQFLSTRYNVQIPNEPFFTANGNVQYTMNNIIKKKSILNLFYYFGYVHPFNTIWVKSEHFMTPPQFIQDLGASYVFPNKKIVISFDAKNIFNKEAYDNFAVQKPGRAFYLKLNYTINNF